MTTDQHSTAQLTAEDFFAHLKKINAGMLGAGPARLVPMSHQIDSERSTLWFITARETDLAMAALNGVDATYVVAGESNLYARAEGALRVVDDKEKLAALWSTVADAWFEGGPQDPDAVALELRLTQAEVWETRGSTGFLFEIARAHLTGKKPDMGTHTILTF